MVAGRGDGEFGGVGDFVAKIVIRLEALVVDEAVNKGAAGAAKVAVERRGAAVAADAGGPRAGPRGEGAGRG